MLKVTTPKSALLALVMSATASLADAAVKPGVSVSDAWVRAAPHGAATGAAYLLITNSGKSSDRLTGGATPVAARVEVHEMTMNGGVMRMRPVADGLELPAGGTVALMPGGYHIMLIGLKGPLTAGSKVSLTLSFEKSGTRTISAPVRPAQP